MSNVRVNILGKVNLQKRINKMSRDAQKKVVDKLGVAALLLESDIKKSMQRRGAGEVYVRGGVTHQASLPGKPPVVDTGNLIRNITSRRDGILSWSVGSRSGAPYGYYLEFGLSRDPSTARPWLKPALKRNRAMILSELRSAVASVV